MSHAAIVSAIAILINAVYVMDVTLEHIASERATLKYFHATS